MLFFQIAAILILIIGISWRWKTELADAVPVGICVLILAFYMLSFFNALPFWDWIAVILTAAAAIYLLLPNRRRELLAFAGRELARPASLTAFFMVLAVTAAVSGKVTGWWDDYNFWATDAKSLFYLNGFAGKYANAAAEFGDYPPGTQMMKWLFLHFSPGEFKEGLMFAGYYVMNLAFLFPLLKFIKKRNLLYMAAGAAGLWLFPTVAEVFWCDGCCADLTMAVIYGAFLMAAVDREGRTPFFYYGRQALFLMVLVLCKNTGFIWAAFGLLFSCGYQILEARRKRELWTEEEKRGYKRRCRQGMLAVTALPVLTGASWLIFCVLNRRVAKLTGTAVSMVTGEMGIPGYQEEMVRAFAEAFVKWPLHRSSTPAIDLSPLALFAVLLMAVILLCWFRVLERRAACWLGIFVAGSGIFFYSLNLLSHLTIFAVETQYLDPFGMVSSIERYGAPFAIGGLYLIGFLCMRDIPKGKGMLICLVFVLLTSDYSSSARALFAYREEAQAELERRAELIDASAEQFLERIGAGEKGNSKRVLYLRDLSDISWVRNTYINYEAAPVSVLYGNISVEDNSSRDIVNALLDAHAGFLYVDELGGDGRELFQDYLDEKEFKYSCLYEVRWEAGSLILTECG